MTGSNFSVINRFSYQVASSVDNAFGDSNGHSCHSCTLNKCDRQSQRKRRGRRRREEIEEGETKRENQLGGNLVVETNKMTSIVSSKEKE